MLSFLKVFCLLLVLEKERNMSKEKEKFTGDFLELYLNALEKGISKQQFMKEHNFNSVFFAQKYRASIFQILEKMNQLESILPSLKEEAAIEATDNLSNQIERLKKLKSVKK